MSERIERSDIVVIGAGMAGLVAARLLQRAGRRVTILDPAPPGGRGRTDDHRGYLWNRGPHALYLDGAADRVLRELGVRWTGAAPGALHCSLAGRVGLAPTGPTALLTSPFLGVRGRAALVKVMARLQRLDAAAYAGRSLTDWMDSLGLPPDAHRMLAAITRISTYSHAPDIAAADMVVAQLQQSLRSGVRYLDGGWQVLVDQLAKDLDVRPLAATTIVSEGQHVVVAAGDLQFVARAVVVALPTPDAAATLLGRAPFAVGPPVEAACLDLGTEHPSPRPVLLGLDEPHYLSDHGAVARLAPQGRSVVHVARYLSPGEQHEPAATRAALDAHAALAGVTATAVVEARYLHRMTVVGALAVAEFGGLRGRPASSGVDGVFLAGDWVGPEGHLLDAAMASAIAAATHAARWADR